MKPKVLLAGIVALLLVGGGAFALTRFLGASEDEAIAFVPRDAYAYANVFVRPSNSQRMALDDLLQKFPGIDDTDEAIRKLVELFDEALAEEGYDYEEDIEPWLGDQFAFYAMPAVEDEIANAGFLLQSKDDEAALAFFDQVAEDEDVDLEEKTYEGETYRIGGEGDEELAVAVIDGFVVAGTEEAMKASIDAQAGDETLAEAPKFVDALEPLREDWIGMFYVDLTALFESIAGGSPEQAAAFQTFGFGDQEPIAAVVYAESDAFVFEATGGVATEGELAELGESAARSGLVPELPAETWAAFGINDVGRIIDASFESLSGIPGFDAGQLDAVFYAQTGLRLRQDVLSWIGDVAIFAQGTTLSDIGGGIVVQPDDPAKAANFVQKLGQLLGQQGLNPQRYADGGVTGFTVQIPGAPAPLFVVAGDRFAIALGEPAAEVASEGGETVAGSEAFQDAQDAVGNDFNIQFFVDMDAVQEVYETFAPADPSYEDGWKEYLTVFNHVVLGSKQDGDSLVQKIVVGLE